MTWKPAPSMTKKQVEKELERQKVLFEEKCATGRFLDGSIKFADFIEKWLTDYAEKQLKATTVTGYKDLLKRVIPALGHIKIEKLHPHHLMNFYDNLRETDIPLVKSYRAKTQIKPIIKKKMLIKDFLTAAGISNTTLKVIDQGKNVAESSARAVSSALGIEFSELFVQANNKKVLSSNTILHYHNCYLQY